MQHLLPKFQIQIVHLICVNHHVFVFNGNGDGRNGVSDRSIGSGIPIPYMFCCQYSCQLLSPLRPRRFHRKTPVRGINRCRSLLPILRIILQYALPGVNYHQLRVYGLLSETMRFDYVLVSNGLPHWMVRTHVYYMSGDAWKEGGIDATGSMMVITLKVISCAINYNDGLLKEEDLRESQKKNRLVKLPSIIEYVGYCLCCGSHFAGPVYEMKDYLDWTERKGIWMKTKKASASPLGATVKAVVQAGLCMGIYLHLIPQYPLSTFSNPMYKYSGFTDRLMYQYMCSFTARWKYYFIWSVSEASMILSGLGFSGWSNVNYSSPTQTSQWGRAINVDILGVEFAKSSVEIPLAWNIHVSTWLRHYVYDRLIQKGKKPGFFQLLATQTVSAVWHGLYPGYIIFFVQSALMISGSRAIYRWQCCVPSNKRVVKKMLMLSNFAYTVLVLNYSSLGFMVLSLKETINVYGSVYYIGSIAPVVLIILGNIIKPKPSTSRARKGQ
uniref:Uncharacterized protein n=1 Tax=Lactuca sativa TaxID=4236 RepID=A0A9R1W533_LACSA|nr:hypothetical protein LSAT_V11C300103790 [Lactuca sativa]